ncbi:MAG TPA: nucleoside-diphosphate sugar epimerase/dehydratase, partial [Candidatus Nanopelagicales bacterium]|nr:nucleoside-diphosphate sugar epimerase/dehydratase [Candidatus Nanopelagicales bacterium]
MVGVRARRVGQAVLDAASWPLTLLLATIARYAFNVEVDAAAVLLVGVAAGATQVVAGWLLGLYRGRFVYGSFDEVLGVSLSTAITTGALLLVLRLQEHRIVPMAAAVVGGVAALMLMLAVRYVLRAATQRPGTADPGAEPVIVLGAGEAGIQLVRSVQREANSQFRVVAMLDDDLTKRRLRVGGVPVRGDRAQLDQVARATGATSVVVAITGADADLLQDVTAQADRSGLRVKVIPTLVELVESSIRSSDVRDLSLVDLLGRHPITTDLAPISALLRGRRVLITGAGGSIGSELARQVHRFDPSELGLLDRDESALHALELSIHGRALLDGGSTILADIRDASRIQRVFESFRPDVVLHAAALKHLPMLERYPSEALKTNVYGTCNVLSAALSNGVEVFVNISTDKAADPISVLGYTKRLTERLTAGFAHRGNGKYLSVRFGNVLGSRGSVLTAFESQIGAGGPVTVTDPGVTRYFMTVSEAVHLVLQAAAVGEDGQALVLDMGEPVSIDKVARQLIERSGKDVAIVYTGLRNGEKLHEVLLATDEVDARPNHPLVSQVDVPPLTVGDLDALDDERVGSPLVRSMELLAALETVAPAEASTPAAP